jgi:hypothetical protein
MSFLLDLGICRRVDVGKIEPALDALNAIAKPVYPRLGMRYGLGIVRLVTAQPGNGALHFIETKLHLANVLTDRGHVRPNGAKVVKHEVFNVRHFRLRCAEAPCIGVIHDL